METLATNYSSMDDLVFEHRNTSYGAYVLRKNFNKHITIGLALAISALSLAIVIPELIQANQVKEDIKLPDRIVCGFETIEPPHILPDLPKVKSASSAHVKSSNYIAPRMTNEIVNEDKMPPIDAVRNASAFNSINGVLDGDVNPNPFPEDLVSGSGGTVNNPSPEIIFNKVEQMPEFLNLSKFLQANLKYPEIAVEQGTQGSVYLSFIVDKDGSIQDVVVLKGISKECDEEAIRVIQKMPKWRPGKQSGRLVKVRFSLPINFRLSL